MINQPLNFERYFFTGTMRSFMKTGNKRDSHYLHALHERVLVFDGAMGTNLQAMNLGEKEYGGKQYLGCIDHLVLSYPQAVAQVHRSFLEAGADVLETDTFRANRLTLKDYGLDSRVVELNTAAARLARKLAYEFSTPQKPRFVAGSIGPSGKLISTDDPQMSDITFGQLVELYEEQATGLIAGGVDLLLIETSQDILEVKAEILGIRSACRKAGVDLPIQAQVTLDLTGRMLLGTDISAVLGILEGMDVDVIGLNCSTGPEHMRDSIRYLSENCRLPISCIPNAGLPLNVNSEAVYPMTPGAFSDNLLDFVDTFHINVVGGCCGTTPEHIRLLAENVKDKKVADRLPAEISALASPIQAVPMQQEPAPFLIGERLNAQGSRKFKQALLQEDFDAMSVIAREQVENGAHGLDVCVAVTERTDEALAMQKLVKKLSLEVPVPLIIDSTELDVIETALKTAPGKCLINSTNLESGEEKARRVFSLARQFNAAVIMLTIDEKGMAKTAERKVEIAQRLHDLALANFGLQPRDMVFDVLTFTLATGDQEYARSAIETLEGIKQVKGKLPGVLTSLGVSNVSFGLAPAARRVINSVFLFHAVRYGLDMAIVNPAQIKPYSEIPENERELAEALIFNRGSDPLGELITYFESRAPEDSSSASKLDELALLPVDERIRQRIIRRQKADVEKDIDELLDQDKTSRRSDAAVKILNEVLLPAMKEVGDKFGAGELILPFVLQSAEVMKRAVAHLENYLERQEGVSKGKIVLATVYGDVHDIGKNLVKTILSNNGYTVVDLGKQVPAELIIQSAIDEKADAIGLSALLVSTSRQMPLIVNELARRMLTFPVLVGGAAINPRFGWRILKTEQGDYYPPGVFYCKDAFEGLSTMDALTDPQRKPGLLAQLKARADHEFSAQHERKVEELVPGQRSDTPPAEFIPQLSSWEIRVVSHMPLQEVALHIPKNELYRLSWGAKNTHGEAWTRLQKEFDDRLEKMLKDAAENNWLQPKAVYGYWPCQAEGDRLLLYDPQELLNGRREVIETFDFPRQQIAEHLSLADYFLPVGTEKMDVVPLQVVTVGGIPTLKFSELEGRGEYSEAYFLHGLAVQMAEATADYINDHIRRELGLQPGQGLRYSWGYPAIPELEDHSKVFKLLPAASALGMQLTTAYQLVPEQSTAAIFVHHPAAKYFNTGANRLDQLTRK